MLFGFDDTPPFQTVKWEVILLTLSCHYMFCYVTTALTIFLILHRCIDLALFHRDSPDITTSNQLLSQASFIQWLRIQSK